MSELWMVDTDIFEILESMGVIDLNKQTTLRSCF